MAQVEIVSFEKRLDGKKIHIHMSKKFEIWKWIFFAFLSFAIIEKMASEVHYLLLAMID